MKVIVYWLTVLALTLGACKSEPFTPLGSHQPVIVHARSGGFGGNREEWRFYGDGRVKILAGGLVRHSSVPPQVVSQTLEAILHAGFLDLEDAYLPDRTCCDLFTYRLSVTRGMRTKTVVTMDGAVQPPGLLASLQATYALIQQIPPAP